MLSDQFKTVFELFEINNSVLIFIKKAEDSSDTVFSSDLSDWWGSEFNEFVEFNWSISFFKFSNDTQNKWVSSINT